MTGTGTLGPASGVLIIGWRRFDQQDIRLSVRVGGGGTGHDTTFRLDLLISGDGGSTFAVVKRVTSTTVQDQGQIDDYDHMAEMDIPVSSLMAVQVWNPHATVDLLYTYDYRFYFAGKAI